MKYQKKLDNGRVQCMICPRKCTLKDGQRGFCHIRQCINGNIKLTSYGYNTGLAIDPIEKKPLYHFYPSSPILSFGTIGCNMGCMFCQNWQTSKTNIDPKILKQVSPENIVQIAKQYDCKSVAFTYNEPIISYEYTLDTAKLCRENGIKTVAVTAGYINPEPAIEFFNLMDAVNIDLKAFTNNFYKKNCLAKIEPILETIKYVVNDTNCWVELTTLLIEGENDFDDEIVEEAEWIVSELGTNVPLHFSAFAPKYKFLNHPHTSMQTLEKAYGIAKNMGLNYVYVGNVLNTPKSTTYCKKCNTKLIERNGYAIMTNNLNHNICPTCSTKCDGIF